MQPLVESYLTDLELYRRSKNTLKNKRLVLSKFSDGRNIIDVTSDDIKTWLRSLNGISTQSQKKYLRYVSMFYDHLVEENLYKEKNPCKKILKEISKAPINRVRETTILTANDVRRIILKASNPRDRSMILLLYKTGIRISELEQLRAEDIDLENKIVKIQKRKGGKKGIVIFDDECKRWLMAYFGISHINSNVFGISTRMIEKIVHSVGLRAGFENLRPHDFRHAFTSHLQEARCHPEVIRVLRGDSNKDMVSYYTHFSDAKNREEYEMCITKLGV